MPRLYLQKAETTAHKVTPIHTPLQPCIVIFIRRCTWQQYLVLVDDNYGSVAYVASTNEGVETHGQVSIRSVGYEDEQVTYHKTSRAREVHSSKG